MFKKTLVAVATTALFATAAQADGTRTTVSDTGVKSVESGRKGLDGGRKGLDTGRKGSDSGRQGAETRTASSVRGR